MYSNIITGLHFTVLKFSLHLLINNSPPPNSPELSLEKDYHSIPECHKLICIMVKESDMPSNLVLVKKRAKNSKESTKL